MSNDSEKATPRASATKFGTSIRLRLLLLAVAAIVPLAIERIYDIEIERHSSIEEARQHALHLVEQSVDKQSVSIDAARGVLKLIAHAYPKFTESKVPCGDFLKAALTGAPGLKTLSVANPQGKIVCSATPGSIGLDISDREFFQTVMRDGGFATSDYALGRRVKGPTLIIAYGERSQSGTVDAVFTALLDLDWIGRVAADIAKRAGSVVLLTDEHGTVLTRYPDPNRWMGQSFANNPLITQARAQTERAFSQTDIDGVRRIFGVTNLPGTDVYFFIGREEAEVLRNVSDAMMRSYSQLAIIAGLVLTGIWFGGERFLVRPIGALTRTATQIGRGQLDARATHHALAAEFGPLASAMDDMAGQLAAREAELRAANDKLQILAQRDGLTGLANRRLLDARLQAAYQMSKSLRSPMALMMIDIDHFKLFNDRYGHVEGDSCLRSVANVLQANARGSDDLAARFGGEEFVLMLPGVTVDKAIKIAERVCRAIEKLAITNLGSPHGHVTVSIGVASVEDCQGDDAKELVRAADDALYVAKIRGRNKVIAHASLKPTAAA